MKTKIEYIPQYKIAYMRSVGPYGTNNAVTMEKLKKWVADNNLLRDDSIILGIAQDNPQIVKPQDCRYNTCFVIPDSKVIRDVKVNIGNILGGKHCVFQIKHTMDSMESAWKEIFPQLMEMGHTVDVSRPILERYKTKMVNEHLCEICVPIV